MMSITSESPVMSAYKACKIGATSWMKPASEKHEDLLAFQDALEEAEELEDESLIDIKLKKYEDQSSHRYLVLIQFVRLE